MKPLTKRVTGAAMIVLALSSAYVATHLFYMDGLHNGVRLTWLEPSIYVFLIIIFAFGCGYLFSRNKPLESSK